jgi:hypothetical protein
MTYDPDLAHSAAFSDAENTLETSHINERKLMTKIDIRVIPVLSVLYLMAFLDRTNIANAAVFDLREDLNLGGLEYNTALVIFFVPYILFEIPSNIILKKLKPAKWLALCMMGFGVVTIAQGLVQNYGGLLTTRFMLGLTEVCFSGTPDLGRFTHNSHRPACFQAASTVSTLIPRRIPGSRNSRIEADRFPFTVISMWYTRAEAQKRYTFFFASVSTSLNLDQIRPFLRVFPNPRMTPSSLELLSPSETRTYLCRFSLNQNHCLKLMSEPT